VNKKRKSGIVKRWVAGVRGIQAVGNCSISRRLSADEIFADTSAAKLQVMFL
jgi:hypothetical protein